MSLILVTAMVTVIVPMIGKQLIANNVKIPGYSRALIMSGSWVRDHAGIAALVVAAGVIGLIIARKQVLSGVVRAMRMLPAFARLLLTIETARFFAVMGAMTKSGVPLAEALGASTGVISDPKLRQQLEWLKRSLVEGGVLRLLLEKVDAMPLATRRLLIAAERSGDLDGAFDSLSSDMADEVDKQSARMLALLEPLLILGMGLLIGPILLAIALPLMQLRTLQ